MSEMQNGPEFDDVLARALQRVNAPESLEKFLMIAAAAEEKRRHGERYGKVVAFRKPSLWATGAIAAALLVGVFTAERIHVDHTRAEQARAAQARQEFETATQITNRALEHARQQMERAGVSLDQ